MFNKKKQVKWLTSLLYFLLMPRRTQNKISPKCGYEKYKPVPIHRTWEKHNESKFCKLSHVYLSNRGRG